MKDNLKYAAACFPLSIGAIFDNQEVSEIAGSTKQIVMEESMGRPWLKATMAVFAIVGLSACAQTQREAREAPAATPAPVMVSEEALEPLMLMVGIQEISAALENRGELRTTLNQVLFGVDSGKEFDDDQLAALLERARSDETTAEDLRAALDGSDALNGIAGFTTLQLLEAYVTGEPQPVRGKIREYYFNDEQKGGYLEVDTEVDTVQGGTVVKTDTYFWAIAIRPETYRVVDRVGPPSTDPFPDTVDFPPEAVNESNPESIWGRNLDQKLFGEGTGVVVVGVVKNGDLLDTTHHLYESTDESCVDLMFWGYPPRSELPMQRYYCLGRCADPQVVNTR